MGSRRNVLLLESGMDFRMTCAFSNFTARSKNVPSSLITPSLSPWICPFPTILQSLSGRREHHGPPLFRRVVGPLLVQGHTHSSASALTDDARVCPVNQPSLSAVKALFRAILCQEQMSKQP